MRFGLLFLLCALGFVAAAWVHGGWWWLLAWPGGILAILALGYLGVGAGVLGKRGGRIHPLARILLAPYLLGLTLLWRVLRWVRREPAAVEVVDGIWIGRYPLPGELPVGTRALVDLTAEFDRPRAPAETDYLNLPTLDGMPPAESALRAAVAEALALPRPVLVHCAEGRGRSSFFVAAMLLRSGRAASVAEAFASIRAHRPQARLYPWQRVELETFATATTATTAAASPNSPATASASSSTVPMDPTPPRAPEA